LLCKSVKSGFTEERESQNNLDPTYFCLRANKIVFLRTENQMEEFYTGIKVQIKTAFTQYFVYK